MGEEQIKGQPGDEEQSRAKEAKQEEEVQIVDIYVQEEALDGNINPGCVYYERDGKRHNVFGMLPNPANEEIMREAGYKRVRAMRKRIKGQVWSSFMEP